VRHLKVDNAVQDRRVTQRHAVKAPLRVRVWKSTIPEHLGEAENISEQGIFFATDLDLPIGTVVEIFFAHGRGDNRRAFDGVAVHGARGACRGDGLDAGISGGRRGV
jgi:hypothetical protein